MNCDKCMHSGVCKNEDRLRAVEYKFAEDIQNTDIESVVLLSVRCKNFKMKYHKKVDKKSDEK